MAKTLKAKPMDDTKMMDGHDNIRVHTVLQTMRSRSC